LETPTVLRHSRQLRTKCPDDPRTGPEAVLPRYGSTFRPMFISCSESERSACGLPLYHPPQPPISEHAVGPPAGAPSPLWAEVRGEEDMKQMRGSAVRRLAVVPFALALAAAACGKSAGPRSGSSPTG